MEIPAQVERALNLVNPRLLGYVYDKLKGLPFLREKLEEQYEEMMEGMEEELKPYRGEVPTYSKLPADGRPKPEILAEMEEMREKEESRWKDGFVSGAVYHGDSEHIDFLNRVYALNSQANPLHSDLWPSNTKYEAEIVSMTAEMLGARAAAEGGDQVCGAVSSGGTESILLAMKAYRDHAREERGIDCPEMVLPVSAHAAFDKAAQYFGIRQVKIPVGDDFKADLKEFRRALSRRTVVAVGSAPCFPHGVVDPIAEMSEEARRRGIGFHTDACLGGFVLPWAERLGYAVPGFDFRLPGVTSMSADTHKYGYAAKGTSVVLYRDSELRRHQFFTVSDWPGGLYFSPTLAGSRPGALSAACWAALVSMGEAGYLAATRKIMDAAGEIRRGIESIPELKLLGDPLWVLAFASDQVDIYRVMELMGKRGWSLNGLHKPPCVHICVTLRHTQEGVPERFVEDLRSVVAEVRANPDDKGRMAPIYGMAATIPVRGMVGDILQRYMELLYKV